MGVKIENNIFVFKLFDKRDKFPFIIVHMPYPPSNIPSPVFYGLIISEFLQIARCTRRLTDHVPKASQLYTRMVKHAENEASILRQIKKYSKDTLKHFPSIIRYITKYYVLTSKLHRKLSQQVFPLPQLSKPFRNYYFLPVNFIYLIIVFSFYSNKFLAFHSLITCTNIVSKTCDDSSILVYCRQNLCA